MTKIEEAKEKAIALAQQIVEQKEIEKKAAEAKEKLQAELTVICKDTGSSFFEDGKWKIDEASLIIQTTLNPPKAIFIKSQESLKPEDRHEIAKILENQYIKLDIDFKKIQSKLDSDKGLKKALKTAGVAIVQETRFDVKRATK